MGERYLKMLFAMLKGSQTTLEIFFLTLMFSIPLALLFCSGRMSRVKIVSWITRAFLLVIRGTPLMLQLLVVYFGPGSFVKWLNGFGYSIVFRWNRFVAGIIALVVNYACYFS